MNERENNNYGFSSGPQYSRDQVQTFLDDLAKAHCLQELKMQDGGYDAFKLTSPVGRLNHFHALRKAAEEKDDGILAFPPNTMDLCEVSTASTTAFADNCKAESELINELIYSGYRDIERLNRYDMPRRIDLWKFDDETGLYLFSRNRVLLRCHNATDRDPDHIIKRSHFIVDENFIQELGLDWRHLSLPALSREKTLKCERMIDENYSEIMNRKAVKELASPHSALYFIKSGFPDNTSPTHTEAIIEKILGPSVPTGQERELSANQANQLSVNTLYIGGGTN